MKLNWAERLMVNNPVRLMYQRRIVNWMKSRRPLPPGIDILEVGCGRGGGVKLIREAFSPRNVFAVDLDPKMLHRAKSFLNPAINGRLILIAGEAVRLPIRDAVIKVAFCFGLLHHVLYWRDGLAEFARVLGPRGFFYFEEYYPGSYQNIVTRHILKHPTEDRFTGPDLFEAFEEQGFEILDKLDIRGYGVFGVARKKA